MTSKEKAESLKTAITQLYTNEGRSISYISRLLEINRKTLSDKIKEWELPEAEPRHHMTPSTVKFLNRNRNLIKARLDKDVHVTKIAEELRTTRYVLNPLLKFDPVLKQAYEEYKARMESYHELHIQEKMTASSRKYIIEDLPGEEWKPILGYESYMISNAGRVKAFAKRYKTWYLIKSFPNKNNGRLYVMLCNAEGNRRNLQVANLVAHAFVPGYDKEHSTVNHEDGDVTNNWWTNLKWTTQAENNLHAYQKLNRKKVCRKRYKFRKIVYKDKYEFKTVAAFARFLEKSETQIRRYMDNPEKYGIKLVK